MDEVSERSGEIDAGVYEAGYITEGLRQRAIDRVQNLYSEVPYATA